MRVVAALGVPFPVAARIFGGYIALLFYAPVRGVIHSSAWVRPTGNDDFKLTQDFGPTSLAAEPAMSWDGGEGIAAGYYSHFHSGNDFGNKRCGYDVLAAQAGKVRFAGALADGNIAVIIDHGNGWQSAVGHERLEIVSPGQLLTPGQKIGAVGDTGNSTACHLHFMTKSGVSADYRISFFARSNGRLRDPWPRLRQNVTVHPSASGVNIRVAAGSGSTPGALFASTKDDGTIRRTSDNVSLGAFSQARAWHGTVHGASWDVAGVHGDTWETMWLDGAWRYIASPLAALSAQ